MTRRHPKQAGFTLIEMLVVLTIMGLLAAIAIGRLPRRPAFVERRQVEAALKQQLTGAVARASASGRPVTIGLAGLVAGHSLSFAPTIGIAAAPIVYPDGSSNGGTIGDGSNALAVIDWMTGRVGDAPR